MAWAMCEGCRAFFAVWPFDKSPLKGDRMMFARLLGVVGICLGMTFVSLSVGCASLGRAPSQGPAGEMLGTWLFENPFGDDEQMAIFADGRVVVLYSNGHRDETVYVDGALEELGEFGVSEVNTQLRGGTLVQVLEGLSFAKVWRRIDEEPRTNLLRPLS